MEATPRENHDPAKVPAKRAARGPGIVTRT